MYLFRLIPIYICTLLFVYTVIIPYISVGSENCKKKSLLDFRISVKIYLSPIRHDMVHSRDCSVALKNFELYHWWVSGPYKSTAYRIRGRVRFGAADSALPFRRWTIRRRTFKRQDYSAPELFFLDSLFCSYVVSVCSSLRSR